jgi:GGDEF domain-containing protein
MSAIRLATLEAAARRTRAVLAARGLGPGAPPAAEAPLSAVLLCRAGRLAMLASALGSDVKALCALAVSGALEYAAAGTFDAFVIDAPSLGVEAGTAVEEARRRANIVDLPLIVVVSEAERGWFGAGDAEALVAIEDVSASVHALGGEFRRLRRLKQELRTAKALTYPDTASGLPGRDLFAAHIGEVIAHSEKPVTLGALRVTAPSGSADDILRPAAALIQSVTRSEDVIAEMGSGTFGLLFPGAEPGAAGRVVARVAGVVQNSAVLAGGSVIQPVVEHAALPVEGPSFAALWERVEATLDAAGQRMDEVS